MKTSNEMASTKTTAFAAISNLGAINAEQTLLCYKTSYKKMPKVKLLLSMVVVEQDLNTYLYTV